MSKILIVEDEESIADLEKDYLELSGFEVETASRGDTGLEKALSQEYDLIILDLMLPGMDGFEVCRRIREVKDVPLLMVSAKKDDIDKIRGLGLGADDYITKPSVPASWLPESRRICPDMSAWSAQAAPQMTSSRSAALRSTKQPAASGWTG